MELHIQFEGEKVKCVHECMMHERERMREKKREEESESESRLTNRGRCNIETGVNM